MSVQLGAREVLTWAVEREGGMLAMVSEANAAAAEVLVPLETLQVLADQPYTVLMSFVEGESFDILVGSGSGEGLEVWRRLRRPWDPDNWKSQRGCSERSLLKWTCQAGRAAGCSGTAGRPDEAPHTEKRRSEWPAPHTCRIRGTKAG